MKNFALLIEAGGPPIIFMLLMMTSMISGFLTYCGISLDDVVFWDKAISITFSIATGIFVYAFWFVVLKVIPELQTTKELTLAFLVCIPFLAAILGFSSLNNVAGIAGDGSKARVAVAYAEEAQNTYDDWLRQSSSLSTIKIDLKNEIDSYRFRSAAELNRGEYTGHAGPGAVTGALDAIAERLQGVWNSIDTHDNAVNAKDADAKRLLAFIYKAANSDGGEQDRMRAMSKASDELRSILTKHDAGLTASAIVRTLGSLTSEVDIRESFAVDPDVARRQKTALARVRSDISQTVSVIGDTAQTIGDAEPIAIESFVDVSATRAVLVHWREYIGAWAGGIGLDLMPLCIVIFYVFAMQATTRQERRAAKVLATPLEDVLIALWGADHINNRPDMSGLDSPILKQLLGDASIDGGSK